MGTSTVTTYIQPQVACWLVCTSQSLSPQPWRPPGPPSSPGTRPRASPRPSSQSSQETPTSGDPTTPTSLRASSSPSSCPSASSAFSLVLEPLTRADASLGLSTLALRVHSQGRPSQPTGTSPRASTECPGQSRPSQYSE